MKVLDANSNIVKEYIYTKYSGDLHEICEFQQHLTSENGWLSLVTDVSYHTELYSDNIKRIGSFL